MTPIHVLGYREWRAYALAAAFVGGNVLLPQLCHLVPQGGLTWLPIYFFTLVAAYKYGPVAGLLTAVLSPLVNSVMFGMPAPAVLPIILVKSVLLALAASSVARAARGVVLWGVLAAVLAYQSVGMMVEWAMSGSLSVALQDIRLGWPGMLAQVFGGYAIMRYVLKK